MSVPGIIALWVLVSLPFGVVFGKFAKWHREGFIDENGTERID